jgi:hypothetical protein
VFLATISAFFPEAQRGQQRFRRFLREISSVLKAGKCGPGSYLNITRIERTEIVLREISGAVFWRFEININEFVHCTPWRRRKTSLTARVAATAPTNGAPTAFPASSVTPQRSSAPLFKAGRVAAGDRVGRRASQCLWDTIEPGSSLASPSAG